MTREENLRLVEDLLSRTKLGSLAEIFGEDESAVAAPVAILAEMVMPGEVRHQNGTRWVMNSQRCRVWDVLRSIANTMERG